jgi:hypothetical protein
MIRNLKAFGLVLVAVFAFGAVAASGASAAQAYLTGDGPLSEVHGTQIGAASANRLTALSTFTHCNTATYKGEMEGASNEHGTTLTVSPEYGSCKSTILGVETHVAMNGCYYIFHVEETTASPADTYGVNSTLECETSGRPTVTITTNPDCTMTIETPGTSNYPGLDVLDNTTGDLVLKGTATGISIGTTAGCPGGAGTGKPASLDAEATITGVNEGGTATNIGISELGETTSTP